MSLGEVANKNLEFAGKAGKDLAFPAKTLLACHHLYIDRNSRRLARRIATLRLFYFVGSLLYLLI